MHFAIEMIATGISSWDLGGSGNLCNGAIGRSSRGLGLYSKSPITQLHNFSTQRYCDIGCLLSFVYASMQVLFRFLICQTISMFPTADITVHVKA